MKKKMSICSSDIWVYVNIQS